MWLLPWPKNMGIGSVFLKEEQDGTLGWTQSHSNIFAHLNKNKCLSSVSIYSYVLCIKNQQQGREANIENSNNTDKESGIPD